MALHAVLNRAGKHFAVRHIHPAVTIFKIAPGNAQAKVSLFADHMDSFFTFQPVYDFILAGGKVFPVTDRVVEIRQAGAVNKFLIIRQAHFGILGQGISRIGPQNPAQFSRSRTFHHDFH